MLLILVVDVYEGICCGLLIAVRPTTHTLALSGKFFTIASDLYSEGSCYQASYLTCAC